MAYSYPFVNAAGENMDIAGVHHFLKTPTLVARRVRDLSRQKFIADFLLQGRYDATGGGVAFIVDDAMYAKDEPEVVQAGAEYPLTTVDEGTPEFAPSEKDGLDSEVYDESIARLLMNPVERALAKLVNSMIRRVDSKTLATIASEVTRTHAAGAAWTTGEQIVEDVLAAEAEFDADDLGLDASVVVLTPGQYAKVAGFFIKADMVAGGITDAVAKGAVTGVLGKTWVTSKHVPFTDPMLVDSTALGGIGLEDLKSPGYVKVPDTLGVETKVQRLAGSDDRDGYRLRVRRVGTAAVIEPRAALRITGTSL